MSSSLMRRVVAAAPASRAFSTSPARGLARITIIGRLADTPEVHATSNGGEIVKYSVASNSGPRDARQTSWFRIVSFLKEGPQRDFLTSLPKGSLVCVEGDASIHQYQDTEGKNRNSLNVVQRHLEALSRPLSSGEDA